VYDMYPWDWPARPAAPASSPAIDAPGTTPAPQATKGPQAVQVALDRRDNGGDTVGAASQPAAGRTRQ
jgi:hypothetical protein